MSSLYHQAARLLVNWNGEDVGSRTDPRIVSKEIVDLVLRDIREHGMPQLDNVASADEVSAN